MKSIILTQCCCGCTVRSGTIIIAVLLTITCLLEFVVEVFQVERASEANESSVQVWFVTMEAVLNIIAVLANVSLFFGTVTDRYQFILAWLITYLIYTIVMVISTINTLIRVQAMLAPVIVLTYLTAWALVVYSILVVNSHYRNLRDGVSLAPRQPVVLIV